MTTRRNNHFFWARATLLGGLLLSGWAQADVGLSVGRVPSQAVIEAARQQPGLVLPSGMRLLPVPVMQSDARAQLSRSAPPSTTTLVVSESGGVVGMSHHEISVAAADTAQVEALARGVNPRAKVDIFPALQLTMIRVPAFADLAPMLERLSAELPAAGIQVPVVWSLRKPK